jgi:ABC-type glycerol-3-phosphate transport system permease component
MKYGVYRHVLFPLSLPLFVYIFLGRFFMRGLMAGSLKR